MHIVQTPEVKKYKANTTNVSIDKTGVVLRAGVFPANKLYVEAL